MLKHGWFRISCLKTDRSVDLFFKTMGFRTIFAQGNCGGLGFGGFQVDGNERTATAVRNFQVRRFVYPSGELTYLHPKASLKMIFLSPRWDMLIPWNLLSETNSKFAPENDLNGWFGDNPFSLGFCLFSGIYVRILYVRFRYTKFEVGSDDPFLFWGQVRPMLSGRRFGSFQGGSSLWTTGEGRFRSEKLRVCLKKVSTWYPRIRTAEKSAWSSWIVPLAVLKKNFQLRRFGPVAAQRKSRQCFTNVLKWHVCVLTFSSLDVAVLDGLRNFRKSCRCFFSPPRNCFTNLSHFRTLCRVTTFWWGRTFQTPRMILFKQPMITGCFKD